MATEGRFGGALYAIVSLVLLVVVTLPIYWMLVVSGAPYALCYWVMSFLISGGVYLTVCLYREREIAVNVFLTLTLCFATVMTVFYVLMAGTQTLTS